MSLGDRWSLLVVRDVMRGKRRYAEFLGLAGGHPDQHPGGSAEAARREGRDRVAVATASIRRGVEYELTAKGEDLRPIMRAMVDGASVTPAGDGHRDHVQRSPVPGFRLPAAGS